MSRQVHPVAAWLVGLCLSTCAQAASFTGTWEYHGLAESGMWLLTRQQGQEVRFQLEVSRGAPSYNSGWIEGTVSLQHGQGVFHTDEDGVCDIAFDFKGKSVRLWHPDDHHDCGFGHNVFAEGTLVRKSRQPPKFCKSDPRTGGCDEP